MSQDTASMSDGPNTDATAEAGAVTKCCALNRNKMIENAQYERKSISKLQIVTEKKRMEIMTHKQHLLFNVISIQI
jgi:hypothetical protein